MTGYLCTVCGTLADPTNSNLADGERFVHRACEGQRTALLDYLRSVNPEPAALPEQLLETDL